MEFETKGTIILLSGLISGLAGYYVYGLVGLVSAFGVILSLSYLLHRVSSPDKAWSTFGFFTNPGTAALIFSLLAFLYLTFRANPFELSVNVAIGVAALGAVIGMFVHKYWNV